MNIKANEVLLHDATIMLNNGTNQIITLNIMSENITQHKMR